jgi:heterodisulfide reductase subunit A2
METKQNILIIGAGIAGMEAASQLIRLGYNVYVVEKDVGIGGHVKKWFKLFPDFDHSEKVTDFVQRSIEGIQILNEAQVTHAVFNDKRFKIHTDKNRQFNADAVLISTGFELFDAHKKEEYGYGIFSNVITNTDLEHYFVNGWPEGGNQKKRFGFIHCVGSRDAKSGNLYCSKVCCATAVKQAIELRQHFPDTEVYCFYMDLRMFGKNYEEMFQSAQEKYGIHFVRARLSEVNQNQDNTLQIKVEDTLTSRPMKMSLDYIILMSGIEPSPQNKQLSKLFGIPLDENGFFASHTALTGENQTSVNGVFLAGAATGPKTITETINDARSAALSIHQYLTESDKI